MPFWLPDYVCPETQERLAFEAGRDAGDGVLVSASGRRYPVAGGVADLTWPPDLAASDAAARRDYDRDVDVYDANVGLLFSTVGADEAATRARAIALLNLTPGARVLETGAGTGRDTLLLRDRLGPEGMLLFQDIAPTALRRGWQRVATPSVDRPRLAAHVGNASYLPFAARSFDACYHAGGINTFADPGRAFREAVRVTRIGGRVVFADETMPPWLRDTAFGRILRNSNPLYDAAPPLQHIPAAARDVSLHWLLDGLIYVIAFTVGEGAPQGNFDLPIAGPRGGTLRTRYEGQLEGVSPDAKRLAHLARASRGISMHDWLSEVVAAAASRDLGPAGSGSE